MPRFPVPQDMERNREIVVLTQITSRNGGRQEYTSYHHIISQQKGVEEVSLYAIKNEKWKEERARTNYVSTI